MRKGAEERVGARSLGWGRAGGRTLRAAVVAGAWLALAPGIGAREQGASGPAGSRLAAQAPGHMAGDTIVLGMADALRIAEGSNPAYRRAVNDLGMNGVESRATWANDLLPNASLDLFSTSYTGNVQRIARDNFGNPIENPQAEWVYFSGTTQSLGLSWNIQGSSLLDRWKGQKRTNLDRELAEAAALSTAHANVRSRFYDVLEQRSLLEVEERIARAREADLELAEQLFRLAGNTRVDLLRARFQIEQQTVNVQRQRNAYEQAKLALRTALGDSDLGPFRLAEEPLPVFDPSSLDAGRLVQRALGANPDVLQAESGVEARRIGVSQARNAWWPTLSFGYNIYRQAQTQESDALFDVSWDEDLDQRFYAQLTVPFFNDYFGNRRQIEQAEVDLDNSREQLRETRLQTEERVRTELLNLQNQYETLLLNRRSLEIAEEALELAREEYRLGTLTFQELQQSVQDEADARRQVATARFGFVDALLNLEEAVGATVRGEPPVTDGSDGPGGSAGREGTAVRPPGGGASSSGAAEGGQPPDGPAGDPVGSGPGRGPGA